MSRDVIIIGAGVIGLSTALTLLRKNLSVSVIDRGTAGQESSWAGGGILSALFPWDYDAPVNTLIDYSKKCFPSWISQIENESGIDIEYLQSGMLLLPPFDREKATHYGIKHPGEIEKYPLKSIACKMELNQGLIYLPRVAQVRNPRLLNALHCAVLNAGGEILEHQEVIDWKKNSTAIEAITTTRAQYSAAYYIVCAGAWSQPLLADYRPPEIYPVRGQILLFKLSQSSFSEIMFQDGFYLIPRKDGHVLAGSTLEDAGFNKETTAETGEFLLHKAQSFFPQLNAQTLIRHWSGLRPGSPNNIPTIARHPTIQNLYINSGHFRYGLTMAPGSAELITSLILNSPHAIDPTPYQWK